MIRNKHHLWIAIGINCLAAFLHPEAGQMFLGATLALLNVWIWFDNPTE